MDALVFLMPLPDIIVCQANTASIDTIMPRFAVFAKVCIIPRRIGATMVRTNIESWKKPESLIETGEVLV